MDEREKLRKFREIDDAFAQALRDMDGSSPLPTSPPPESPDFETRLSLLMEEYALSRESVRHLVETLVECKQFS
nr:hypothetical protein [Salinicola aestuarinus]